MRSTSRSTYPGVGSTGLAGLVVRPLISIVAVLILLIGSATTVRAHEGEEGTEASLFVQQAIALIVNTPDDLDAIGDKINDAIEAPDQDGVDVSLVERARTALQAADIPLTRSLLEQSIGARSKLDASDPLAIDEHTEVAGETEGEGSADPPAIDEPTEEPGETEAEESADPPAIDEHTEEAGETEGEGSALELILDPLDTGRDLGGGDWWVIGFAGALVLAGAAITTRFRPAGKPNR